MDRRLKRSRSLKSGRIFHQTNGTSYDCTIVDLNSRGAKIRFQKTALLGQRAELLIKPEDIKVHGRITWKDETSFGLEFDRPLLWLEKHDLPERNPRALALQPA